MTEGILLPTLPRGTLLSEPERWQRLQLALPQIVSVVSGETDAIALQATLACLLWETLSQSNFCGFYRCIDGRSLIIGPYQGSLACLRIAFGKGVCGTAAEQRASQRVPDVTEYAGHIACDSHSRSELVIPIFSGRTVHGVLDLDSPHLDAFSEREAAVLEELLARVFNQSDIRWG